MGRYAIGGLSIRIGFEGVEEGPAAAFLESLEPFSGGGGDAALDIRLRRAARRTGPAPSEDVARALWEPMHRFPFEERARDWVALKARGLMAFTGDPAVLDALERASALGFDRAFLGVTERGPFWLDPETGRAEVFLAGDRKRQDLSPHLTSVFFQLLAVRLAACDGLLVHGSGLARAGRGFAFVGLSGAGKSTVGRISGGALFSDDGLVLRRDGPGFRLWSSPFCQQKRNRAWKEGVALRSAPLEGLFFLEKALEHRLEPVAAPEAALMILQHFIHYFRLYPHRAAARAFETAAALVRARPVRTLHFRKDAGFWDLVE